MVKNVGGGNKSKRQARRHINTSQQKGIRYAKNEGEMYALVIKIEGGSNVEVMCSDGVTRLCIIRNKFKGRGKRDNKIEPNSLIMVGLRDWEVTHTKRPKCDLLEVYSALDKETIRQSLPNLGLFKDEVKENTTDVVFDTNLDNIMLPPKQTSSAPMGDISEEDIDVEDI